MSRCPPLGPSGFGRLVSLTRPAAVRALRGAGPRLRRLLYESGGLLLVRGLADLEPRTLVEISGLFGEVEDYRPLTPAQLIHPAAPEVFLVSNRPPANRRPPDRPAGPESSFPITFPARRGWHVDQGFRVPPPDVSLLYAVSVPPIDQGQTLVADATAAYRALPPPVRARLRRLEAVHVRWGTGRTESEVLAGRPVEPASDVQRPHHQPAVRRHPVTGREALYLSDSDQIDAVDGPFHGLETGPHGAGAALLHRLLAHVTRPEFVHTHTWRDGDLLILDNRSVLHAATWYDADRYARVLWRTTVHESNRRPAGHPGAEPSA